MRDRRRDDRVVVGCECMVFVSGLDDIEAIVKDISECGIAFEIPYSKEVLKVIQQETELKFAYLDSFVFLDTQIETVLQATCKIARVIKKEEKIVVGCELHTDSNIKHYVTQKKVNRYMDIISSARKK